MIPLEKQVTSLELSKRLKELGVKQDSFFAWVHPFKAEDLEHFYDEDTQKWVLYRQDALFRARTKYREIYAAFTVAEHGEAIKEWCKDANFCPLPLYDKQTKKWNNHYADDFIADTEADARAKMRIWLIENKLVEAK